MNNFKEKIVHVLETKKEEIVRSWYEECSEMSHSSKEEISSLCQDMIEVIIYEFQHDDNQKLKALAKKMGTKFADAQLSVSDIFMNFKIFRRIMWTKIKESIELPRRNGQDTYDYGIKINHILDDLFYWCTVYYDKELKAKFKCSQKTIQNLQEEQKLKEQKIRQMHEQKLEVIGQLAAGMAHELRNPLTSIKGFLQLIFKEHSHPERVQSYFDIISKEFDRLHVLLNHFLTLARRNDSDETERKAVSINHILDKMIEFIQFEVLYRSIDFKTDVEENLLPVYASEAELEQVFLNLLKNSFEAVQNHKEKRVSLKARNDENNQVIISIFNTGDTIPSDMIDQIFEPFISLKSTGTGLGLSICKHIIDAHHGDIDIESSEEKGTTITVKLPAITRKESDISPDNR
ncbi:MAG: GHKL domain-containing protein [Bacillaceae bacterium]|nr:GHKL domain-containing protein [Bacillaceae bacterium]